MRSSWGPSGGRLRTPTLGEWAAAMSLEELPLRVRPRQGSGGCTALQGLPGRPDAPFPSLELPHQLPHLETQGEPEAANRWVRRGRVGKEEGSHPGHRSEAAPGVQPEPSREELRQQCRQRVGTERRPQRERIIRLRNSTDTFPRPQLASNSHHFREPNLSFQRDMSLF